MLIPDLGIHVMKANDIDNFCMSDKPAACFAAIASVMSGRHDGSMHNHIMRDASSSGSERV